MKKGVLGWLQWWPAMEIFVFLTLYHFFVSLNIESQKSYYYFEGCLRLGSSKGELEANSLLGSTISGRSEGKGE